MLLCASLLKLRGLGLKLLKSMFDAENFMRRLSWSISSHFVATHSLNVRSIQQMRKIRQKPFFWGGGFKVTQGYRCCRRFVAFRETCCAAWCVQQIHKKSK